ncbi:MAG: hypothetical protein ACM3US_05830 [Sphingomonadaceae bacterium]
MQRLSIIRWQQTQGKYVGILQDQQRFKPETLRPVEVGQGATVLVGELVDTFQREWYCITFPKEEMEFEEARDRARAVLEVENQRRAAGKPSLAS